MTVLLITEDHVRDQYVLKPLVKALFTRLGKPKAIVQVCTNPRLRGVADAMSADRMVEVFEEHPTADIFILCVDRDGQSGRRMALDSLEARCGSRLPQDAAFLGVCAHQEIEVWILAGMTNLPPDWSWSEVRAEPDAKEHHYLSYATKRDVRGFQDQGRRVLSREAATNLDRVLQLCPEDLGDLKSRLEAWLAQA